MPIHITIVGGQRNVLATMRGAIDDFTQVIKLKPDDAAAYITRAGAKTSLEDYAGGN